MSMTTYSLLTAMAQSPAGECTAAQAHARTDPAIGQGQNSGPGHRQTHAGLTLVQRKPISAADLHSGEACPQGQLQPNGATS